MQIPINSKFVINEGAPIMVNAPSIEDILGDKLTAFAPNTTGIPYFKGEVNMSMEIMKQLYDVGNLIAVAKDGSLVKTTFENFTLTELEYRNKSKLKVDDVLEDIFQTSLCLVSRGAVGKGDFNHLKTGIQRVSRYIFSEVFHIDKAITFASRAAYISRVIKSGQTSIEKFNSPAELKDWTIGAPFWLRLNRLKKSNPEAFFYWYKTYRLTTRYLAKTS